MDKVTVVVPCYNVEKYILKCINSIKDQTYKNLEIILVDDGSKDKTKTIIKKEIKNDKRFMYVYKKNGGLSSARNKGLELATGKYITFIDSDDYIEKDYVIDLYNEIIKNNVNISICNFKRIYKNKITESKINNTAVKLSIRPAAWNKMYLTSLFKKDNILFPEGKWYEDLGTTTKLILTNDYSIVDKCLYNYIQRDSSIIHTYDDRIFQIYEIVNDIEKFAKDKNIYEEKKDILEFINIYHVLVGTIYRSSFHNDFSSKMIMEICNYVEQKYKYWYKNKYIKESLSIPYKLFLRALKYKQYKFIYIILRLVNKYLYL